MDQVPGRDRRGGPRRVSRLPPRRQPRLQPVLRKHRGRRRKLPRRRGCPRPLRRRLRPLIRNSSGEPRLPGLAGRAGRRDPCAARPAPSAPPVHGPRPGEAEEGTGASRRARSLRRRRNLAPGVSGSIGREPGPQRPTQFPEGRVPTVGQGDDGRQLLIQTRRQFPSTSSLAMRRPPNRDLQCLLRIGRLAALRSAEPPPGQGLHQRPFVPPECTGQVCGVSPRPRLEFRLDDDGPGSVTPTVDPQAGRYFVLDSLSRGRTTASVVVEDDQRMVEEMVDFAKVVGGADPARGIVTRFLPHDVPNRSNPEFRRASQHRLDGAHRIRIGDEDDQVLPVSEDRAQPKTPVENRAVVSTFCFHSLNIGWRSPRTMSVVSSSTRAKQKISSG